MMTRTVNFARLIFIASLCIVLFGCGGGGNHCVAPPQPMAGDSIAGEYQHILSYGQSLSLGARAVNRWPTDLTIPPEQDVGLMFASGVIPRGAMNALVPFADSTAPVNGSAWNIDAPGVTPLYGALLELSGLPGARIGSAAGRGGTPIAGLSKGTAPYVRLISQVAAGRALSAGHYIVPPSSGCKVNRMPGIRTMPHNYSSYSLPLMRMCARPRVKLRPSSSSSVSRRCATLRRRNGR